MALGCDDWQRHGEADVKKMQVHNANVCVCVCVRVCVTKIWKERMHQVAFQLEKCSAYNSNNNSSNKQAPLHMRTLKKLLKYIHTYMHTYKYMKWSIHFNRK